MSRPSSGRVAIVSGYFNPLHVGHVRMMQAARAMADALVVIVNNDDQQAAKSGRVIRPLADRLEVVRALSVVDEAVGSIDHDATVSRSLADLRRRYPGATLVFCNGGDRSDEATVAEADLCRELGIELALGVGGTDKADASSRINQELQDVAEPPADAEPG